MDLKPAQDFLTRCFAPGETIALLLRRESPQESPSVSSRWKAFSRLATCAGSPMRMPTARTSTLLPIRFALAAGSAPRSASLPFVISISTSTTTVMPGSLRSGRRMRCRRRPRSSLHRPANTRCFGVSKASTSTRQESTLKRLAIAFGGDPACTDCNRVLRIPGFLNRKYDPAHCVTVEYPCASVWTPLDFHLETADTRTRCSSRRLLARARPVSRHFENDWAWVSTELAHGKDAVKLTHELASRRSDKPNPLYYAQRTVDVASARLWLLEGIRIDDVITMLESTPL